MAADNRTAGEKARDGNGPTVTVETIRLKDAMAKDPAAIARNAKILAGMDGNGAIGVPDPERMKAPLPTAGAIGNGVPPEMLAALGHTGAGGNGMPASYQPPTVVNGQHNQFPVASPLTLIDQARNIQEALEHFARSLLGAAEWCGARANEMSPLEAGAILFAAKILREDAKRCTTPPVLKLAGTDDVGPVEPDADTSGTTAPE